MRGWLNPEVTVYRKYYLFDVVNAAAAARGDERPRLVERGPFVYREVLEKRNVTFPDDETIQYLAMSRLYFEPDLSNGSLNDQITFINLPALVIISFSQLKYCFLIKKK